jgi:WD40 repeat protein
VSKKTAGGATSVGLVELASEERRDTSNWFQRWFSRNSTDKAKPKLTYFNQPGSNRAISIAWHPSGEVIAVAYDDTSITVWRVRDGKAMARYSKVHGDEIRRIVFSQDGRSIYSVGFDGHVRATSTVSDSRTCTLFHLPNGDLPMSLALRNDNNLLGVGSIDGRIYLIPIQGSSCR